jgi:hypothetical protein
MISRPRELISSEDKNTAKSDSGEGVRGAEEEEVSLKSNENSEDLPLKQDTLPRTGLHMDLVGPGRHSIFQLCPNLSFKVWYIGSPVKRGQRVDCFY